MRTVWTIAQLTFREAIRRRIVAAALAMGILFLLIYALGFSLIQQEASTSAELSGGVLELREMRNFLMLAGLYVVNFLTVMMTVLVSVDTLSGEIATGTIHSLLSKPVRRWEVVVGKWLGFAGMLTLYLLLTAGGVMAIVYVLSGYFAANAPRGFSLMWLNILVLLSVSLWGGTRFSTLTNGVLVFGLYGIAFVAGWIEQIGSLFNNQSAINVGIVSSLLLPSEALWKGAAASMQSALIGALGFSPFTSTAAATPSAWMIGYAILYTAFMLWRAIRHFQQRDV
jgi:Cu-processing system permease protein